MMEQRVNYNVSALEVMWHELIWRMTMCDEPQGIGKEVFMAYIKVLF
jgi:hypothetical protein